MSVIQQIRLRNYDDFHDNEDKRQGKGNMYMQVVLSMKDSGMMT